MVDDSAYSQSRIAKNTLVLCFRMLFTMGVTLYTSRVVLDVLGVEDYGIYSIIGGFVVLLAIVSSSMRNATQRFITFELGKGDSTKVNDAFSMSMIAHAIISLAIILLGETIGLWYVKTQLNIPVGRESATMIVYQISLLTTILTLMRSPYDASVIAYEKMSFFAVISIVDVLLKLLIVYLLSAAPFDKLIVYSCLILCTNIIVFICYYFYCQRRFDTCNLRFVIDRDYFKKLFGFLGWSLLGASASLGTQQAGNLIINKFLGVAINAAYGVANQVNSAINSFVSSFQVAFTPQIVKLYSQNRLKEFYDLCNSSAVLSYYILFIISFPIVVDIDYVLSIWLVETPQYAGVFCSLLIIYSLIDAIQAPFWIGINATGNIKIYEIWLSIMLFLNIPLSILVLKLKWSPYWVLGVRVILNLITAIIRCFHVKIQLHFPLKEYLIRVVLRALCVSFSVILVWYLIPHRWINQSIWSFLLFYILCVVVISAIIFTIGIGSRERNILLAFVKHFLPIKVVKSR